MIQVNNISVSFGSQQVLQNINFSINEEKTLLIIGKSGCGKSVLMKTIAGLIEPDAGQVLIDGVDLRHSSPEKALQTRQKLAMLFQGSALLDSLNVYQNVSLPLFEHSSLKPPEIKDLVENRLELVGLKDVLKKMPSELSGGMKKRVAFARAVIINPSYIIYDEPTTGLDPVIASEIVKLIGILHNSQKTASVIVTHDLYCLSQIKGRIVMLADKQIIFDGCYQDFINSSEKRIKRFLYSTKR